jgi:hypothetical protein
LELVSEFVQNFGQSRRANDAMFVSNQLPRQT